MATCHHYLKVTPFGYSGILEMQSRISCLQCHLIIEALSLPYITSLIFTGGLPGAVSYRIHFTSILISRLTTPKKAQTALLYAECAISFDITGHKFTFAFTRT